MKRAGLMVIAALIVGVGLGSLSLISVSAQNVPVTTVTGTVTADSELAAAAALADNTANPTIPGVAAFLMTWDGSTWDRASLASDWTVGTAIGTTAPGSQAVYSDFDGAALPTITNVDTEGEAVPTAASIKGVQYFMPVNEDGSATAQIRIWDGTDTALVDGSGYLQVSLASVPSHAVTNAGTFAVQVDGAALTALQLIDDAVFTDDAAFTPATSKGLAVGFQVDDTTPDSVDEGDFGVPRMSANRFLYATPAAGTAYGADSFSHISVGSTEDEHAVKATAGTLYSITATNTNAAVRYLKCENDTAANTAPGTDTPELRIAIPGAATGAGFTTTFPLGWSFSTALTCWIVTGAADSDVAEVAANEIMVFYTYK